MAQIVRKKVDAVMERNIITGMIVNNKFIRDIQPILRLDLLKTAFIKIVAGWCLEYYNEFEEAPGVTITNIFESKKENLDEDIESIIDTFLGSISEEYETTSFNAGFVLKEAEKYFNKQAHLLLAENMKIAVANDEVEKAEVLRVSFREIARPISKVISPFSEKGVIHTFDKDEDEFLFSLPGAMGDMIYPFCRGHFVSLMAPMKRGKCTVKDTFVQLSDGNRATIEYVVNNKIDNVMTKDNDLKIVPTKVSEWHCNGIKPVYAIRTKSGRRIKVTSNHQFYSFGDIWQSIDEGLSVGSYIAAPKEYKGFFGTKKVNKEHLFIMAGLIADGGLSHSEIVYSKQNAEMRSTMIDCIENLGDNWNFIKSGIRIVKPLYSNTEKMLQKYGIPHCKSIEKILPDIVFQLDKEHLSYFLNILFTGDGTISAGEVEYSTGSEKMAMQIQHLLLRFGIVSRLVDKKVNETMYYLIKIRDTRYIKKYLSEIGFSFNKAEHAERVLKQIATKKERSYLDIIPHEYRSKLITAIKGSGIKDVRMRKSVTDNPNQKYNMTHELFKYCADIIGTNKELNRLANADVLWDKIVSIEYVGEEMTYDITVPETHNFIANDIVIHNSFFLIDWAIRGFFRGLKVIFFSLEMTEIDTNKRIYQNIMGTYSLQAWELNSSYAKEKNVSIPYFDDDDDIIIKRVKKKPINQASAIKKTKQVRKMSKGGDFRLQCIPGREFTIAGMKEILFIENHKDGFIPDLIVIDYMDIKGPEPDTPRGDNRARIDHDWKTTSDAARELNCAILSATQGQRGAFSKDMNPDDVAEDIRKLAHVTRMIAINKGASAEDEVANAFAEDIKIKKNHSFRLNMLAERHGRFDPDKKVRVLHSLEIGKPYLDSREIKEEKE